jgi:hypothetical protein
MALPALEFSEDQAEAWDRLADVLRAAGVDPDEGVLRPDAPGKPSVLAVVGKAGSGKTMLLASLYKALSEAGVDDPPHPLHAGLRSGIRADRGMAGRPGRAAAGRGADGAGAGSGQGVL